MAVAIIVLLIGVLSVVFHNLSPWWFTPLASNWKQMDDTIVLTIWITGVVFIIIVGFLGYVLFRYRHREGGKAHYEPENKKLEWWLLGITTVGIVILLVPGLLVWAKFVETPGDAMTFEAVGQQWQWSFRFPGKNGMLGRVDPQRISADNPFGLSVDDPRAEDDYLVQGGEVHIPVNKPIQIMLRSKDVLHDFYVPHFRVKMDIVPGLVTKLWFTPTRTGKFEIACAEYCGMGHHTMRGMVYVDEEPAFQAWLEKQKTFAESMKQAGGTSGDPLADKGKEIAQAQGCVACHSLDGSNGAGPTWKGLYGKTENFADGSSAKVDEAYLKEAIAEPNAKIVKGYSAVMPPYKLGDEDLKALLHYLQNLDKAPAAAGAASGQGAAAGGGKGQQLAQAQGCMACHSVDGSTMVGPTWKGMFGKTEELADGSKVTIDEAYFKESIAEPNAKIVKGFSGMMPPYKLSDEDMAALVDYAKSLSGAAPAETAPTPAAPEAAAPAPAPETKEAVPAVPAAEPKPAEPAPEPGAAAPTETKPAEAVTPEKPAPAAAEPAAAAPAAAPAGNGKAIAESWGCLECHSTDGSAKGGPSFKGLFGKSETLTDGSKVTVDEAYFKESVVRAGAKQVQGFDVQMPSYNVSDEELNALIDYAKGLK
jgi:cytochrome c oxidase subunit 2